MYYIDNRCASEIKWRTRIKHGCCIRPGKSTEAVKVCSRWHWRFLSAKRLSVPSGNHRSWSIILNWSTDQFGDVSRILWLEPASEPKNFRAEPEKLERASDCQIYAALLCSFNKQCTAIVTVLKTVHKRRTAVTVELDRITSHIYALID